MADIALGYRDGSADEILYGVVRPRPPANPSFARRNALSESHR